MAHHPGVRAINAARLKALRAQARADAAWHQVAVEVVAAHLHHVRQVDIVRALDATRSRAWVHEQCTTPAIVMAARALVADA